MRAGHQWDGQTGGRSSDGWRILSQAGRDIFRRLRPAWAGSGIFSMIQQGFLGTVDSLLPSEEIACHHVR